MVLEEDRIVSNYQKILSLLSQYAHGGQRPQLVMVTKSQPKGLVSRLIKRLEHPIIGENRVQEALKKIEVCGIDNAEWHFIGHLQRNKVKKILGKFSLIHSLNSLSLAKEIEKRAVKEGITVKCLLQIDICQDGSKFGLVPREEVIKDFLYEVGNFSHIKILGLMTIAPYIPSEETRVYFRRMRVLYDNLKKISTMPSNVDLRILSMGMSNDYITALEEGSTMIRLGNAIFGELQ